MHGPTTVYVKLFDEGTDVWRPVVAEQVGPDLYRLAGPIPETESWVFPPGTVVRCRQRVMGAGGRALVAVAAG